MESLFFHPKLVHLPIALGVLMPLVFVALVLAVAREWLPLRALALAAGLQAVLVVSGVVAIQSGEAEEERVEARVGEAAIEAHEHAAKRFVAGSAVVLAAALVAALARRRSVSLGAAGVATLGSLVVFVLGYQTGEAGGQLVYGNGGVAATGSPAGVAAEPAGGEAGEGDD